jgi:hypothetical protein
MRELHKMREDHSRRTKNMSLKKVLEKIHEEAKEIEKKYHLDLEKMR